MKSELLISVQHWTTRQFADLMRFSNRVQGIILSDPFCPLRMFEHGNWDIPVFCQICETSGAVCCCANFIERIPHQRIPVTVHQG